MVSVGAITVELNLDTGKLTAGLRQATSQLNSFANQAKRIESDVSGMGTGISSKLTSALGSIGTAALATGAVAVTTAIGGMTLVTNEALSTFADFEQVVANTASVTGKTGAEFEAAKAAISELSKVLGAETKFSAEESAQAMYTLASAGIDVASMTKDQLKPSLDLAAGTQTDLTKTMETMVAVSSQFGIAFEDSGRVADVFATSIGQSQATMEKLAYSFNYVGPVAEAAGMSFEKTTAALSVLYDNGLKGQQAGTGLRGVIASLANPSKEAAGVLAQLGLTVEDVNPETHDLSDTMALLQERGMTTTQAFQLFNRTAAPAAQILANNSAKIDEYTEKLENAGGTAETLAEEQLDTLAGAWEILESNYENLMLGIGESLTPLARRIIEAVTEIMPAVENFAVGFAEAFVDLVSKLESSVKSIERIGEAIYKVFVDVFGELSGMGIGTDLVHGINVMMSGVADAIVSAAPMISTALRTIIDLFLELISGLNPTYQAIKIIGNNIITVFKTMFSGISASGGQSTVAFITDLVNSIATILSRISTVVSIAILPIIEGFKALGKGIAEALSGINFSTMVTQISVLLLSLMSPVMSLATAFGNLISSEAVVNTFSNVISLLSTAFVGLVSIAKTVGGVIGDIINYLKEHPQVTKFALAIVSLVAGFGALRVVAGAISSVMASLPLIIPNLVALFEGLSAGISVAITSTEAVLAGLAIALTMGFKAIVDQLKQFDWSGVWQSIVTAFSQIITYVSPILTMLAGYFAKIPEVIAGAMQNLAPVVGLLASVFKAIIDVVTGFIGSLGPTFENIGKIFDGVLDVIFTVGGALVDAVSKLIGGLAKQFSGIISTIDFKAIGALVASGFNRISEIIASFVETFSALITSVDWSGIFNTIVDAVLAFTGWIADLPWGELINFIVSAFQGLVDYLGKVDWDKVFGDVAEGLKQIWEFISGLPWDTLFAIVSGAFKALADVIESIDWEGIFKTISEALGAIWDYISGLDWSGMFTIVSDAFGIIWDYVSSLDWEGFFKWIADAFGIVWDFISGLDWSGMFTAVKDAFGTIWEYIKDIDWEGIFNTIADAFKTVAKAIGDIEWGDIFGYVKDAFKTIWEYIKDIDFSKVLKLISGAFESLYNSLKDLDFGKIFESITKALSGLFGGGEGEDATSGLEAMKTKVEELKTSIETSLEGAKQALADFNTDWDSAWDTINTTTSTAITNISSTITSESASISTSLDTMGQTVVDLDTGWSTAWETINTTTTTAMTDISSAITTGTETLSADLSDMNTRLSDANTTWESTWTLVEQNTSDSMTEVTATISAGNDLIQTELASMIASVVTMNTNWSIAWTSVKTTTALKITEIVGVIKQGAISVKSEAPSWRAAGEAIGQALVDGLNSKVAAVKAAASSLNSASKVSSSSISGTSGITRSGGSGTGETNVKITTVNNNIGSKSARSLRT